ncbi:MAG: arginine--tRNA ligase [Streptococcus parasanguinis]
MRQSKQGRLSWQQDEGQRATNVTIDLSSPNIAKPFSVGHLRSTVIGDALSNIFRKMGYNTIKINHLGDWGKQFGLLDGQPSQKMGKQGSCQKPILIDEYATTLRYGSTPKSSTTLRLDDEGRLWFKKARRWRSRSD